MKKFLTAKITRTTLDRLIAPYATNARTLEIGSRGQPAYIKYFPNRVGLDIEAGPGVDIVGDVESLPFEDESFERVICVSVLEHVQNPGKAISEMRRVLKKGHKIVMSVPFLFPLHETPGDFWRFTKYGLQRLFQDGWIIERIEPENSSQISLASLLQRLAYQTKLRINFLSKLFILVVARILDTLPNFIIEEYGDIRRQQKEDVIFPSGYFLVATKQ